MLDCEQLRSKLRYKAWFSGQNVFVATVWYALGFCEKDAFMRRFKGNFWVYKSLDTCPETRNFARANVLKERLISEVARGGQKTDISAELASDIQKLCYATGIREASSLNIRQPIQALYSLLSVQRKTYFYLESHFPPFLYGNLKLRELLIPANNAKYRVPGSDYIYHSPHGCRVCVDPEHRGVLDITLDANLLAMFGFAEYRHSLCPQAPTLMLIDGENTLPAEFKSFWCTSFNNNKRLPVKIVLVCPKEVRPLWEFVLHSTAYNYSIVECNPIVRDKSLVDMQILCEAMKSYFVEKFEHIWVFSSDSDFYTLQTNLDKAKITFVSVRQKTAKSWRERLSAQGCSVFYIDASCTMWNHGILLRNFLAYTYSVTRPDLREDEAWAEFTASVGLPRDLAVMKKFRNDVTCALDRDSAIAAHN